MTPDVVDLAWTPWALPALLAGAVTGSLAAFVYWARPERTQNRRLALQLTVEMLVVVLLNGGAWIVDDPDLFYAATGAGIVFVWIKLWTYYNFLATLPTSLARNLERPPVRWGLLAAVLALGSTWVLWPEFYVGGVTTAPFAAYVTVPGTGWMMLLKLWAVLWLVGLIFAVSAYRQAPTELLRRQGKGYMISFGIRDLGFAVGVVALSLLPPTDPAWLIVFVGLAGLWVVYPLVVTYVILKTQLFDIDLKLKLGVERSTIVGVFGVTFLSVSEVVEAVLAVEGTYYGVAAAVAIGLFFRRIEAGAERVADALMPGVADTEAYREERKRTVYRASLEELLVDGEVTAKERRMLGRLQEELGLDGGEAGRIEADVLEGQGDPA